VRLRISALLLILSLGHCSTPEFIRALYGEPPAPSVHLTYTRIAYRCSILVQDMELPVRILPRASIPYSDQAFAGIRVGYNFPVEYFREIMTWARNYYPEVRYIMLTDPRDGGLDIHYRIHLGVRTDEAFSSGWEPWSSEDFDRIKSLSTQEDMRSLLLRFRTDAQPLPYQRRDRTIWWNPASWF
jgi:hypothetical protein